MVNDEYRLDKSLRRIYLELLEREIDETGLNYFSKKLFSQEYSLDDIKKILQNSEEYSILQFKKEKLTKLQRQIQKPIFIIGVPRSGTTLLYNILCSHKELAWLSYNDIDFYLTLEQKQLLKQKWISHNDKIPIDEHTLYVLGKDLKTGLKHFGQVTRYPGEIPIEGEVFLVKFFGSNYIKNITLDQKLKLLKEVNQIIKRKNKKRFLNKAPQNSMRLFALKKCFPDAKFINIYRNPLAVISSMCFRNKEEGKFNPFPQIKFSSNLDFVKKFSYMYKEIIESTKKFESSYNDENFTSVFYENLVKNPVEETRRILNFCELNNSEPVKEMIPKISLNTKNYLSQEQQKKIILFLQPVLIKFGLPYKNL